MATTKIIFSALTLIAIGNIALATEPTITLPEQEEKKQYFPRTHHTFDENTSTTCKINEDHIIVMTEFKKDANGICSCSGPLMLAKINEVLAAQHEPVMDQKELELAAQIAQFTASECDCKLLRIIMKKNGNPAKLHALFNQVTEKQ